MFKGLNTSSSSDAYSEGSPQKRARTRITDEQLKILRQHFDINNSPSEEQIREMSIKAGLPEKVIKHWFRNTLFKVYIKCCYKILTMFPLPAIILTGMLLDYA